MSPLTVPVVTEDDDTLGAALRYAAAGWYVLPVKASTKHAGSVLGTGWPAKSSRDPAEVTAWFAGEPHALALHVGRSGAVAFDVDDPAALPASLVQAFHRDRPPHQSTRRDTPGRGHYLYAAPVDRDLGNSTGSLGGAWGEVRGRNGIIVVTPSQHEKAASGGRYAWQQAGPLPSLPGDVAACLPDALAADEAATDAEVQAFLDEHGHDEHRELLAAVVSRYMRKVGEGASRHGTAQGCLTWGMKEARAGLYPAREVVEALYDAFTDSLTRPSGKDPARRAGVGEWAGILAWAVAQAKASDADTVRGLAEQEIARRANPGLLVAAAPPVVPPVEPTPDATATPALQRYTLDWAAAFAKQREDVEWIVPGLVEAGRLVAIYSKPKAGKSLILLDWAASLATGRPVLGERREPVTVLYCDLEMTQDDVVDRLGDLGYRPEELERLVYVSLPTMPPLDTVDGGRQLYEHARHHGARLVVVDTAMRTISGPEDEADTWGGWYLHTAMPLKREGIAVVRLDHSGKDVSKGQRGSSAKASDVDAVYRLVLDGTRVDLLREEHRQPYLAERVVLNREERLGRLVHAVIDAGQAERARVDEIIAALDALGALLSIGRRDALTLLTDAGHRVTHNLVREAVRRRKELAGWVPYAGQDPATRGPVSNPPNGGSEEVNPHPQDPWKQAGQSTSTRVNPQAHGVTRPGGLPGRVPLGTPGPPDGTPRTVVVDDHEAVA